MKEDLVDKRVKVRINELEKQVLRWKKESDRLKKQRETEMAKKKEQLEEERV